MAMAGGGAAAAAMAKRCTNPVCVAQPASLVVGAGGDWRSGWPLRSEGFALLCEECQTSLGHAGLQQKYTTYMEEAAAAPTFMCSKLYVAAFEGRTEEVISILNGSGQVPSAAAARIGRPSPAAPAANASHPGPSCSTREVTAEHSTLLHIAAAQGHCGLIAELIRRDRDLLSSVTSSRDTPLHFAARAGHADAVAAIARLASRADDNDCDVEEARRLPGVVLRAKNRTGDTALHVAARHGRGAAVEALMGLAPALAAELNGAGVSPLYLAVVSGSVPAVAAVVAYGDAAAAGPMSQNALHAAVLQSSEMVSLLLQWRPILATDLDSNKSSPLHFAASTGDCSIIEDILKHAPPNAAYMQDSQGLSPLHAAALMGNLPAVRLLLQYYPASSDIRDNLGRNFLHAAAMRGHNSIISYVIKNRLLEYLLNEQDQEGNTTLHLALQAGEYGVVSKLLSSGKMQVHIMNNDGHTPADLIENSRGFYLMATLVVTLFLYGAQFRPQRPDHVNKWNGQDIMKWRQGTSKNLAIVSTLVATVAFSAAFNVPGSYGSDGKANLNGNHTYNVFLVLDTIALTASVVATILLVYGGASRSHRSWRGFIMSMHFLWLSLIIMMLAFFVAIAAVTSDRKAKSRLFQPIYAGLYILISYLTTLAMPGSFVGVLQFVVGGFSKQQRCLKKRISQQYPFGVIYAFNMLLFIFVNTVAVAAMSVTSSLL